MEAIILISGSILSFLKGFFPKIIAGLTICIFINFNSIYGQSILVIVNTDSKVYVDGTEQGKVSANDALKIPLSLGEHYIQAKGKWNGVDAEVHQTINIDSDKQIIIKLNFGQETNGTVAENLQDSTTKDQITVADLSFKIPGKLDVNNWKNANPGKNYPDYPLFYYAFAKGDEIVIDFKMENKKGTNKIIVFTYPHKVTKYSNEFSELHDVHIKVEDRSIYCFAFESNFAFQRDCRLSIKRIPASPDTKGFNPSVSKKNIYKPISIQSMQEFTINSRAHVGGTNKETIPINLPPNTVEWFYKFSAFRNKAQVADVKNGLKLFDELSSLCEPEGKAVGIGVELLSTPPGTDYCDVYLLDEQNHIAFENGANWNSIDEGNRLNLMFGKVQVKSAIGQMFYLGITNPSELWPISVIIEAVAITQNEELVMEQQ
jgi:hypothetical protein